MGRSSILRRQYAVPSEHGSWVWWLGPFAIGLAAGGHPGGDVAALLVAALAGFLLHQPAAIAVKASTGRRPPADLRPALVWVGIYAAVGAVAAPCLVAHGHARVLGLLVPGAVVFGWHLWLVARRAERRQMGVSVLGAGVLALAAPAAYWVAGGTRYPEPWVLWALCWVHSAASIANAYLRLDQRLWKSVPPVAGRVRAGRTTLSLHAAALAAAALFADLDQAPWLVLVPYGAMAADALVTVLRPRLGVRPAVVGVRQFASSVAFVVLVILAWRA